MGCHLLDPGAEPERPGGAVALQREEAVAGEVLDALAREGGPDKPVRTTALATHEPYRLIAILGEEREYGNGLLVRPAIVSRLGVRTNA